MNVKRLGLIAVVALSAVGGVAVASVATGGGEPATLPPGAHDGTPRAGTARIDARARAADGSRELGLLVYRNRDRELCMAYGETSGDQVGVHRAGGFEALPLREGGTCGLRLDPVAASVTRMRNQTVITGVANEGVTNLAIASGANRTAVDPGDAGGFIATFDEELVGDITITTYGPDGEESLVVPGPGRSLEEMSEEMKRDAPKPGDPPYHP